MRRALRSRVAFLCASALLLGMGGVAFAAGNKTGDYFEKAVLWAAENGVTGGTSAATFSPAANCTRGRVVTFLYRDANRE